MLAPALQTIIVTKYCGAKAAARYRRAADSSASFGDVSIYFDRTRSKYIDTQMKIFYIAEKCISWSRWENNSRTKI